MPWKENEWNASNLELLARIVGREAAIGLFEEFGSLTGICREPVDALQRIGGLDVHEADRLKASFQLAAALTRDKFQ